MTPMKHKHHHPPQHRVGKHNNTIEVSVEEHAELHLYEYLCHGEWQDWVAYHALSGQITMSEASKEAMRRGASNANKNRTTESRRAAARKGNTPEVRAKKSATMTGKKRGKYNIKKIRTDYSGTTGRIPKPVKYGDNHYTSIKECAMDLGIPLQTAYKWRTRGIIQ